MFFGDSGSIAGGTMPTPRRRGRRARTAACARRVASYSRISGSSRASVSGFGVERSMWQRQIQCFAPVGRVRRSAGRLRVVDDDHVPVAVQALGVHRVVGVEHLPLLVGDRLLVALERVVHQLGDVEELLAAEDHVPVGVEADVAHQRHQRVEDLRDAAAERRRADVEDALALQRLGELADLARPGPAADEVGVVGQRALPEGDFLKHARQPTVLAQPARCRCRARSRRSPRGARGWRPPRRRSGTRRPSRAADVSASGAPAGVGDHRPRLLQA